MKTQQWRLGDEGYEVDWVPFTPPEVPGDPDDCNPWEAEHQIKYFRSYKEALAFAKTVVDQDYFRSVILTPFTVERLFPNAPSWATTFEYGEPEHIETDQT